MLTTCHKNQNVSILLVLSMIFSIWMSVAPINSAQASILGSIASASKSIFVNVGAVAAGALTAVAGMAIGGGPLGMAAGGVAGFIVGKKVLGWTTSSVANFAIVAGAVGGGLLCAGMGFPMLAVGVLGGGLIAKLVTKGVTALFGQAKNFTISSGQVDKAAAAKESAEIENYIASLHKGGAKGDSRSAVTTSVNIETSTSAFPSNSQDAYNRYNAAYKEYTEAAQAGNSAKAKVALEAYRIYFKAYSDLLSQGK